MCMIKWGTVFIKSSVAQITVRYLSTPPVTTNVAKGASGTFTCIAYGDDVAEPSIKFYGAADSSTEVGSTSTPDVTKTADGTMFTYTRTMSLPSSSQGSYNCKATWAGAGGGNVSL